MPRPASGVWLTTAIWVAVTLGLWGFFEYQLEHGTEIRLRAVPVDPRDVLRGDFVVLRYPISVLDRATIESDPGVSTINQEVFVTLVEEENGWEALRVGVAPPEQGLFLRGRVRSASAERLEIVYGIESFFVPEGEGRRYEEARDRERLWAVVSVSPQGVAILKGLEID